MYYSCVINNKSVRNKALRARICQPTSDFTSICLQTKLNDHPYTAAVDCSSDHKPPTNWLYIHYNKLSGGVIGCAGLNLYAVALNFVDVIENKFHRFLQ